MLTGLGVDLERARQQVIELLRGSGSEGPPSEPPGREDPLARLELLGQRLAAIERWVGMRPRLDDLDQEIARVGRDKETAIDAQDFEGAVVLRDREKELLADKDEREKEWTAGPALADEVGRLGAELVLPARNLARPRHRAGRRRRRVACPPGQPGRTR